jgi:hypothetical protein
LRITLPILTDISNEGSEDEVLREVLRKENKERMVKIYNNIADNYLHNKRTELESWAQTNKLLAKDNKFYYPKELAYITIDGFNAPNIIYTSRPSESVIELFRILGVKVIDKVTPKFSNRNVEQESLRKQLEYIAPLIALVAVEKSKIKNDWEPEYNRIKQQLSKITFYETTSSISLSYGNEEDTQERSTYADGNNFYYVGNWYKPRVLDGLVEPLCKFLEIRYAERILTVLLSDDFNEGLKYLEEKGLDISLIPENLKKPPEPEGHTYNQDNRKYNQSDADLGKKGEMFVFDELKRIYEKKYNQSITETEEGFKIGKVEVIWRNISANTTANHDFKITENGKEIYIDSKATPYGKNKKVALYVSDSELDLMERAEKYLIARVYDVTDSPSVKFVRMKIESELTIMEHLP